MEHELKTWPEPFQKIWDGKKLFEFRKNDRGFEKGDLLRLREWSPITEKHTRRFVLCYVPYILNGPCFGLPKGYCIMSVEKSKSGFLAKTLTNNKGEL